MAPGDDSTCRVAVTAFGTALTFMMIMYAPSDAITGSFSASVSGCLLSAAYGFLAGAWPFGIVELIRSGVALPRWLADRPAAT